MSKNKDFFDKPIFTLPSYLLWFLQGGAYFFITNILLVLFITATAINPDSFNLMFLFISLLPLGPSLSALSASTSEILREKSISFSSYFFKSYKDNFVSSLKLWLIILLMLALMFVDFQYFFLNMPRYGIHIIFEILAVYIALLSLYAIPINSRFEMKTKDIFILSSYYIIKKLPITILQAAILVGSFYLVSKTTSLLIIVLPCIISFIFSFYDSIIFTDIECRQKAA